MENLNKHSVIRICFNVAKVIFITVGSIMAFVFLAVCVIGLLCPVGPGLDECGVAGYSFFDCYPVGYDPKHLIAVNNVFDSLCNWCIAVMWQMTQDYGLSYGFLNIALFCVLEPLAIVTFMLSSFFLFFKRTKVKRRLAISSFILGILCLIAIAVPILHTVFTMKTVVVL